MRSTPPDLGLGSGAASLKVEPSNLSGTCDIHQSGTFFNLGAPGCYFGIYDVVRLDTVWLDKA